MSNNTAKNNGQKKSPFKRSPKRKSRFPMNTTEHIKVLEEVKNGKTKTVDAIKKFQDIYCSPKYNLKYKKEVIDDYVKGNLKDRQGNPVTDDEIAKRITIGRLRFFYSLGREYQEKPKNNKKSNTKANNNKANNKANNKTNNNKTNNKKKSNNKNKKPAAKKPAAKKTAAKKPAAKKTAAKKK